MSEWQIEMLWDCRHCKHVGNLGRHKECQNCGHQLDEDEEAYMPGDISREARVRDSEQLKHATAGADWNCRYCDSMQRKLDGSCAQCGSDQKESAPKPIKATTPKVAERYREMYPNEPEEDPVLPRVPLPKWVFVAPPLAIAFGFLLWFIFTPKEVDATVVDVYFQHGIHVERYQSFNRAGWDPPHRAYDVERHGERVHHHDRVIDHYDTEYYNDQVRDGETCRSIPRTCRSIPRSCRTSCSSNKNGYATCRESCSGGGQSCSGGGQSCSPKYKTVRKSRQVPRYKDVPVYRMWYSWKIWEWAHHRDVFATGHSTDVRWPSDDEVKLNQNLRVGEEERIRKSASYTVKFKESDDTWNYEPKDLNEFQKFAMGSVYHIKVQLGSVTVEQKVR